MYASRAGRAASGKTGAAWARAGRAASGKTAVQAAGEVESCDMPASAAGSSAGSAVPLQRHAGTTMAGYLVTLAELDSGALGSRSLDSGALGSGALDDGELGNGLAPQESRLVLARSDPTTRSGALGLEDGRLLAGAALVARRMRIPLVMVLATSGADIHGGVASLHGWGLAAKATASLTGEVPVIAILDGPVVSGPALMAGMADIVIMTDSAFCYISGPDMVREFTGIGIDLDTLGGPRVHSRLSGLCTMQVTSLADGLVLAARVLSYLPPNADTLPPPRDPLPPLARPLRPSGDSVPEARDPTLRSSASPRSSYPPGGTEPSSLASIVPAGSASAYDVRAVMEHVLDAGSILELRASFAPQIVTALARLQGQPVGVVANQPRSLAGTLDIAASQKAARFVRLCDASNLPIITLVDTPGFLPGKDLEWRGMIRHGAELAFAYSEATVPRIALILRKAYGGAYIVMDSKGLGNDLCFAWPTAEIAVMGAKGALQILGKSAPADDHDSLEMAYAETYLTPWVAAERGYVDDVITPDSTRDVLSEALTSLVSKRENLAGRKHDSGPL